MAEKLTRYNVLEKAMEATMGPRNRDYGEPLDNMMRAADIFAAMRPDTDRMIGPVEVVEIMIAVKMSRLIETPEHADSHVDLAAYWAIRKEIIDQFAPDWPKDEEPTV